MTVSLDVYDLSGRKIVSLASGRRSEGFHTVVWDGRSASGERVSSGVYLYRLKAGDAALNRKMLFMR
jgi:flagellar hook assembly protein FlgD